MAYSFYLLHLLLVPNTILATAGFKPNIVLIIADDLGWGDIGFSKKHGTTLATPETPNLDILAEKSVILDNLYVQNLCTPTRSSLLTGRYPHSLGWLFSASVIIGVNEYLKPEHRTFTEILAEEFDYSVRGAGKWHLGFKSPHLPLNRGFESFYGCYSGGIDHHSHEGWILDERERMVTVKDFHSDNLFTNSSIDITSEVEGKHSTELFTQEAVKIIESHDDKKPMLLYLSYTAPHSPLEPDDEIVKNRNEHIVDKGKRQYAAMVTQIDNGVGEIADALSRKKMWDNTVFLFMSDHGAAVMPNNCWDTIGGSNLPYRDGKGSYFEGGIKSAAFIWTPWLTDEQRGKRSPALLHAVDVHSLMLAAADDKLSGSLSSRFRNSSQTTSPELDSGNFLIDVLNDNHAGRETILHNLVTGPLPEGRTGHYCSQKFGKPSNYAVLRHKKFKLFYGNGLENFCQADYLQRSCSDILDKPSDIQKAFQMWNVSLFNEEEE
ncbi:arylsulfatase B-like isoform X2 [Bolinopsis microptera]|uniref:arylsulfatase B-like isoform X2 n=1 Tax=Bolinopsis microptera TaxID=2820187 RepID=UPI00307AF3A1